MGQDSKIEWTDHTFNPWMGCTKVSAGCKNCYAENQMDHRWNKAQWGLGKPRVRTSAGLWRKPLAWNAEAAKTGIRPRVFSASLGDWLDPEVPTHWLADFLDVVEQTRNIDWLLLTKRPELWRERLLWALGDAREAGLGCARMLHLWSNGIPPKNVWIGTSVEDQDAANKRIPELLKIPAAVRFLSCEPLLGPVEITRFTACPICHGYSIGDECDCDPQRPLKDNSVDWVICGGESGPHARPMHPDWARGLRDQCQAADVPFFFKQWGEWGDFTEGSCNAVEDRIFLPSGEVVGAGYRDGRESRGMVEGDWRERGGAWMSRVGKKKAGRLLDGSEWNEVPEVARAQY